ncbi:MAG: Ldh family oxidoreductase [Nitriliruptorales bacterium]|nr:Ldh family oxidoreductase [Nitriliruptorales bacterium]
MADRIPVERLREFAARVLLALEVDPAHATTTARRLVDADLRGRTGHGMIRLAPYSARIRAGGYNLRPAITVVNDTPVSALVDGDNGLGQVVVTQAVELAVEKARNSGIGWVGTVHSNHAGAAGVYTAMALQAGFAAMYFAVANGNGMPPWGGRERLLGTNPLAVAFPGGDQPPFELDIATTVASHGTIEVKARAGEPLPEGWVVDFDGAPITDPARVEDGFLVPIGGYKGAGLNFVIGAIAGVMTGAAFGRNVVEFRHDHVTPTNTGQSILVFRPDLFLPDGPYDARMGAVLEDFRSSESSTDAPIRLPGDRARATAADNLANGIAVAESVLAQLRQLADELGVEPLPA